MKTFYEIHCRSGVICSGGSDDFLACILLARQAKARFQLELPNSQFRVQLRYPNGYRVAAVDVKSALRALENPAVHAFVTKRMAVAVTRSGAAAADAVSAVAEGDGFSQAGVVAPHDSPDFGKTVVIPDRQDSTPDSLTGETRPIRLNGKSAGMFFPKVGRGV